MFEYFLATAGGYSSYRVLCSLDNDPESNTQQKEDLVDKNVNTFVGWLLFHISSIGSNGRRQQFYHTFLAHYLGLSRNGIDNMHRFGYTVAVTNFDSMRREVLQESIENTRYVIC
jgi:hypothetical protein